MAKLEIGKAYKRTFRQAGIDHTTYIVIAGHSIDNEMYEYYNYYFLDDGEYIHSSLLDERDWELA